MTTGRINQVTVLTDRGLGFIQANHPVDTRALRGAPDWIGYYVALLIGSTDQEASLEVPLNRHPRRSLSIRLARSECVSLNRLSR